ncbi:ABC transporter permease [Clostridium sardiniense]|uniref:ABC transporter permease n=1 Tax=Clostridium sardiniense TaxID=29369 RepID=A0ABS7KWY1_CLOSR|nr:ABC transporter permease [Clostridium sardiniense]MBY0755301.1 ABC transporter permease [Clostridium sardiniense]MDQ0459746.1 ABC-2 type transport system permease protein [Clostridium sardiniense]
MRNILVMLKNNLRMMILKKPLYFIASILAPVVIILIVGSLITSGSSNISIGVANLDKSKYSELILKNIEDQSNFTTLSMSKEDIEDKIKDKSIECGIIIQKGFQDKIVNGDSKNQIEIIGKDGDSIYKSIESMISINLKNLEDLGKISNGDSSIYNNLLNKYESNKVTIERGSLRTSSKDYETNTSLFVGFLIMFMFFRSVLGAGRILEDKKTKVYTRIFAAPIKVYQYYLGNILASILAINIQAILSLVAIRYLMDIDIGMSYIQIFFILFLVSILAVAVGTFCIAITRSSQEASIISNILIMTLLMLGGCFVPVQVFPNALDKLSKLLPTRWAMDMVSSLQDGIPMASLYKNIVIIVLYSAVFFLAAAYITKRKDKKVNIA